MTSSIPPGYLTTKQAARILGVSARTVRRWIAQNHYRLGDYAVVQRYRKGNVIQYRYFLPTEVVFALLEQRKRNAAARQRLPPAYLHPFPSRRAEQQFNRSVVQRLMERFVKKKLFGGV